MIHGQQFYNTAVDRFSDFKLGIKLKNWHIHMWLKIAIHSHWHYFWIANVVVSTK